MTSHELFDRWQKTWQQLGAAAGKRELYEQVRACYMETHRHYHTLQHLEECFGYFDQISDHAEHPAAVELALWFHDAIYNTSSQDNEEKSAQWAYDNIVANGLPEAIGDRVAALIQMTKHNALPVGRDAEVLSDVDLSIFAATPARFDEYERQIRAEYAWVPEPIYRRERRKVLQAFAKRSSLYATALFREQYEATARKNLSRALDAVLVERSNEGKCTLA